MDYVIGMCDGLLGGLFKPLFWRQQSRAKRLAAIVFNLVAVAALFYVAFAYGGWRALGPAILVVVGLSSARS